MLNLTLMNSLQLLHLLVLVLLSILQEQVLTMVRTWLMVTFLQLRVLIFGITKMFTTIMMIQKTLVVTLNLMVISLNLFGRILHNLDALFKVVLVTEFI